MLLSPSPSERNYLPHELYRPHGYGLHSPGNVIRFLRLADDVSKPDLIALYGLKTAGVLDGVRADRYVGLYLCGV